MAFAITSGYIYYNSDYRKSRDTSIALTSSSDGASQNETSAQDTTSLTGAETQKPQESLNLTPDITTGTQPSKGSSKTETETPVKVKEVSLSNGSRTQSDVQTALYNFLKESSNRDKVLKRAKALNEGDLHNACVYYTSEALRKAGVNLSTRVNYTGMLKNEPYKERSLTYQLLQRGWKVDRDLSNLLPGDICFTTNSGFGSPTHAYTFMGWVEEGSYDYAYICDNQLYDYGSSYHKRNVKIKVPGKEAFQYFMYKPL